MEPGSFGDISSIKDMLNKINTYNAGSNVHEADLRAFQSFKQFLNANPDLGQDPRSARKLSAFLAVEQQKDIDRADHLRQYQRGSANGLATNVYAAFDQDNPQSKYDKEREAFIKAMEDPNSVKFITMAKEGKFSPEDINAYFKRAYGVSHMDRYYSHGG